MLCAAHSVSFHKRHHDMHGFPGGSVVKDLPVDTEDGADMSLKITSRRKWQSAPVLLPGKFHGQRSLL